MSLANLGICSRLSIGSIVKVDAPESFQGLLCGAFPVQGLNFGCFLLRWWQLVPRYQRRFPILWHYCPGSVRAFLVPPSEIEFAFDFLHTFEIVVLSLPCTLPKSIPILLWYLQPLQQDMPPNVASWIAFQCWKSILFPEKMGIRILSSCPCISWFLVAKSVFGGLREWCNFDISSGGVLADCTYSIVV